MGRGADRPDPVRLAGRLLHRGARLVVVVGEVDRVLDRGGGPRVLEDRREVDPGARRALALGAGRRGEDRGQVAASQARPQAPPPASASRVGTTSTSEASASVSAGSGTGPGWR